MASTKLYILGNGFDLRHGIPSAFWQFKEYVQGRAPDIHTAIDDYITVEEDWSDLEDALATLDTDSIVDELGHFAMSYAADDWSESGHHDFQFEVDRVIEHLSVGLKRQLADWILQLPIPTADQAPNKLTTLKQDALFLSFNYTDTLTAVYGVADSQILHIHGRASEESCNLILGHAWAAEGRRRLNDRPDVEELDTRYLEVNEILDEYFTATFKPSHKIIQNNAQFLKNLDGIAEVTVLGHSLSDVDALYIEALLEIPSLSQARWTVACRKAEEEPEKLARLIKLGVRAENAFTASWEVL